MGQWFDDDAFWTGMAPYMFDAGRWERAPDEVDAVVDLLGIEPPAAVLDLCCGPGRHARQLHRLGYRVTAVDRTRSYLDDLRAAEPGVEAIEADMRDFERRDAFDAILNLYTSFGYFEDPEDDARVARRMRASLAPGGRLLIDLKGREALAQGFTPRGWTRTDDGALWLHEIEVVDDWSVAHVTWRLFKDGTMREHRFFHRLYTGTGLRRLLRDVGFARVDLFGDLEGTPYGPGARRLVAVARID